MNIADPISTAAKHARSAIELMEQHKVPASPDNFAVWYAYVNGTNPNLVKAIDDIITKGVSFTKAINEDFFKKFCDAEAQQELGEMRRRIEGAVAKVVEYMGSAISGATQYGSSLEEFSGKLAEPHSPDEMSSLVNDIISATNSMIEANNQLSQRLTSSAQEAAQLKQDVEILKREASVDHLTKLYNRKWFDASLGKAQAASNDQGGPLSLLMIDIDFFKKFNDTYGHQLGDQVLKLVARTITECVDDSDTPARYGGEEFAVVLPGVTLAQAIEKAENIRKTVAGRKLTNRTTGKVLGQVTLSVGVAQYIPGETQPELISRADEALYFAKRNGRNRVGDETDLTA